MMLIIIDNTNTNYHIKKIQILANTNQFTDILFKKKQLLVYC